MNKREQEQFAAFLQEIYETEQVLDFIKHQLASSNNYQPTLLFELISQRSESISIQQMRNYLVDKLAVNERELYQIFQRFDWTRQGSISRQDFLNQLAPFSTHPQPTNAKAGTLSAEIEGHFISLLVQILNRFRILQVARKQIKSIQPYDAFEQLDYLKTGYIGVGELRRFFYDNDFNVTDKQLYYLLHGLRRRCYRDVNLEVFCQNLDPLEFGEYSAYANELEKEREEDFLRRSRNQEETMKRSRVQAQRIEHQFQKAQRKRQAQLERQLQLQDRVNAQILTHEQQKERQIRRALLEQDKNIRHNLITTEQILHQQQIRSAQQKLQNQYLLSRKIREEEANAILAESALRREQELQRSRRVIQRQRELQYRAQIQRERQLIRQAAVEKQLQLSKRRIIDESRKRYQQQALQKIENQSRRRQEVQLSRKKYDQQLSRKRHDDEINKRYEYQELLKRRYGDEQVPRVRQQRSYQQAFQNSRKQIEQSRRLQEESRRIEQQSRKKYYEDSLKSKYERELELQKLRARQDLYGRVNNVRSQDYQKELERTRYQIQERRSRLSGGQESIFR